VANTLVAVEAGVTHVQGTANGYGERAGNANLFSVVAGLQLKKGRGVLDGDGITEMTRIAHAISEVTNVTPDTHQPYVGLRAFELLLRDELAGERRRHFTVESWRVIVERREDGSVTSEATVRLAAKGERVVAVGEGNGPVNALDKALRSALEQTFPELANLELA